MVRSPVLLAALCLLAPAPGLAAPAPAVPTTLPADQRAIIDQAREALASVAKKSARARALLDFYDKAAVPAWTDPDLNVRVIAAPKSQPAFFVAANPHPKDEPRTGSGGEFATFACYPTPVLQLKRFPQVSTVVLGVLLAHELTHAEDCLLNGEPESEVLSDNWLIGELHAHETEATVLHDVTDGK